MIDSQINDGFDPFGAGNEESLVYPELLIKTDLLNDSGSDNLSDDHSIQLSIQGISLMNESQMGADISSPQLNEEIVNTLNNKRPQTAYKIR